jgi:hypothetical protein
MYFGTRFVDFTYKNQSFDGLMAGLIHILKNAGNLVQE